MKQTAVEWLIEELGEYFPHEIGGIHLMVNKAKEMEKQQIIKSRENGISEGYRRTNNFYYDKMVDSDIYYAKTYGSKGSDEHIEHNLDEIVTSSQTEISDEEITNLANEHILYNDQKRAWVIEGMKLYREQLKSK